MCLVSAAGLVSTKADDFLLEVGFCAGVFNPENMQI